VARLSVFNFERVAYDFGEPIHDGRIGLATKNGEAFFDDVLVESLRDAKDFEFVELANTTGGAVDLTGWQLSGGIDFAFADNRVLDVGETVVVVSFDPQRDTGLAADFRRSMGIDASVKLAGPFLGELSDTSDLVELLAPVDAISAAGEGQRLVDRVAYATQAPWPMLDRVEGKSLHRLGADRFGDLASSWWVSAPSPGSVQFARPGDLDRNGLVDVQDIGALVVALTDPAAYEATYGVPAQLGGDFDADGDVDYDDIRGLAVLLAAGSAPAKATDAPLPVAFDPSLALANRSAESSHPIRSPHARNVAAGTPSDSRRREKRRASRAAQSNLADDRVPLTDRATQVDRAMEHVNRW